MTEAREANGRVALVMAASKGLGYGCADAFAERGYSLVVCSRNAAELDTAAEKLRARGTTVEAVPADVSKSGDIERVFARARERFGHVDVLVCNAGGPPPGSFLQVSDDQWQAAFELTHMSAVRSMRLALAGMIERGFGWIIVIGSSSVKQPIENLTLSNAFRPALLGVVKSLAQEVAGNGVTVNIVSPGRIDTDRVRTLDESRARARGVTYEEFRREYERSLPVGRYGQPRDLGQLAAFLASDVAAYITGQSILVDGGMVSSL